MKKCFTLLITLAIILFSCSSKRKQAIDQFAKAKQYYIKNDYGNALKLVNSAELLDSNNYDVKLLKAKIKSEINQEEEAIQILKSLLPINFKSDTVNYLIGNFYFGIGTYYSLKKKNFNKETEAFENSIKYSDISIGLNPRYFNAYLQKQRVLHNLGRYDEAMITLSNAITFFQDSMNLIYSRGVEKHYLGDNSGAMTDLNFAIKSNKLDSSDLSYAYRFRGSIYQVKDSLDKAINDLTAAINFNPKDELAYADRADLFRKKGEKDKACMDYRKAAELGYILMFENIKEYCEK